MAVVEVEAILLFAEYQAQIPGPILQSGDGVEASVVEVEDILR